MTYPVAYDFPIKLKPSGNRWVIPGWYGGGLGIAKALNAGRLHYCPIFVEEATTYIRIAIEITIAAGGGSLARLGIYDWQDGLPSALVLDAGTVATDAIAVVEIVIDQILRRGYYFLAVVTDSGGTGKVPIGYNYARPPVAGFWTSIHYVRYVTSKLEGRAGDVAGGLADPAPAPTSADWYKWVMLREN